MTCNVSNCHLKYYAGRWDFGELIEESTSHREVGMQCVHRGVEYFLVEVASIGL